MKAPFTSRMLLAGRSRLLAQIGAGGFGAVYQARDQHRLGTLVAIKTISMTALSAQEQIEATDSFNRKIMVLSVGSLVDKTRSENIEERSWHTEIL